MDSFEGAVLICDITGFTQLTEQLSKQGPSGVEQLTKCMNNYFTKVSCTGHIELLTYLFRELRRLLPWHLFCALYAQIVLCASQLTLLPSCCHSAFW